ncbi:MAG: geranylgeranylglyceryl/heptaprenylglyceryl phosphate synthase, partial [Nitrososphaerales archaeon]
RGIPRNKPGLAAMYALAAQYFGMRFFYLEAGSGADEQVSKSFISSVRSVYEGTLVVGGGINTPEQALQASRAGADVIVVGSLLEKNNFERTLHDICISISHK